MHGNSIFIIVFLISLNLVQLSAFWQSRDDMEEGQNEQFFEDETGAPVEIRDEDEYYRGLDLTSLLFHFLEGVMREQFPVLDSNGDGVLHPSELTQFASELLPMLNETMTKEDFMRHFDVNQDGVFTPYEVNAFARRFLEDGLADQLKKRNMDMGQLLGMLMG